MTQQEIAAKDLIEIAAHLETAEVNLRFINEGIDTTTVSGKLFFQIFGALAEFERNLIRERTQAGLQAARSRGRIGGRPRKQQMSNFTCRRCGVDYGLLTDARKCDHRVEDFK